MRYYAYISIRGCEPLQAARDTIEEANEWLQSMLWCCYHQNLETLATGWRKY